MKFAIVYLTMVGPPVLAVFGADWIRLFKIRRAEGRDFYRHANQAIRLTQ